MADTTTANRTLDWLPEIEGEALDQVRDGGVLHEINRLILHPIGLAMGIRYEEDRATALVLYDGRGDPEGLEFDPSTLDPSKAQAFARLMKAAVERRLRPLGFGIQPVESLPQVTLSIREPFEHAGLTPEQAEALETPRDAAREYVDAVEVEMT